MKQTRQIDRPLPSELAKRGLKHVDHVDVEFAGGTELEQQAALDHLSELIAWWNLNYIDWIPRHDRR